MKMFRTLPALFTLVGTTIGIGVLAIPYSFSQSGLVTGMGFLLLAFVLTLALNLMYTEVLLSVKGKHQIAGYAGKFFGRWGRVIASVSLLIGTYGAMLAYMVQGGVFINSLIPNFSPFYYSLGFFFLIALVTLVNVKVFSTLESVMVGGLLLLVMAISVLGFHHIVLNNYGLFGHSLEELLLPYGVLLFAFSGYSVIPELGEMTNYDKNSLRKAVIGGTALIGIVYLTFALVVLGVSGSGTTQDAISGIAPILGEHIGVIATVIALLAIATSFISLARVSQDLFVHDLNLPKAFGWFFALYPALILFFINTVGFVRILEISGGLTVGLTGILLTGMYYRLTKDRATPSYIRLLEYAVVVIFVAGIGYELVRVFGF